MIEDNGGVIIEVLAGVEIFWKLDNMMVTWWLHAGSRLGLVAASLMSQSLSGARQDNMRLRLRPGPCLLRLRALVTTCHSDNSYAPAPSHGLSHAHVSHSPRLVAWRKSETENQEKIVSERCILWPVIQNLWTVSFPGQRLSLIIEYLGGPCHCLPAGGLRKALIATYIQIFIQTEMMKWNFFLKNMFFPCRTPAVNMIQVKTF